MASQADLNEVSTLVETNNLLTKQLIEKNDLITIKDQKYIKVLEVHFKGRLEYQKVEERFQKQESENAELKKKFRNCTRRTFVGTWFNLKVCRNKSIWSIRLRLNSEFLKQVQFLSVMLICHWKVELMKHWSRCCENKRKSYKNEICIVYVFPLNIFINEEYKHLFRLNRCYVTTRKTII